MKKNASLMRLGAVLLVIAIVVALFFIWEGYIRQSSGELLALSVKAEELAVQQKWDELNTVLDEFEKKWDATWSVWQIFVDHIEIDNIRFSFARVRGLARIQCLDNLAPELSALSEMLRHIPIRETLNVGNLF
ncbi:MAG: DUF4363 family protein [Bacillota bacterium]|nr:DUF4363 family protein [Bacillota bacterium]